MRLAADTDIRLNGYAVRLRPSLRAAHRLEQKYGGFNRIVAGVVDQNVTLMADVIREGAVDDTDLAEIVESIASGPLGYGLEKIADPLFRFVLALAGVDPDATQEPTSEPPEGKRITFAEYHRQLFRIGTGWLGWSAEETWSATPAEIAEAYKGRIEFLKATNGLPFGDAPEADPHNVERDHAGFEVLKNMARSGANKAA